MSKNNFLNNSLTHYIFSPIFPQNFLSGFLRCFQMILFNKIISYIGILYTLFISINRIYLVKPPSKSKQIQFGEKKSQNTGFVKTCCYLPSTAFCLVVKVIEELTTMFAFDFIIDETKSFLDVSENIRNISSTTTNSK